MAFKEGTMTPEKQKELEDLKRRIENEDNLIIELALIRQYNVVAAIPEVLNKE